MIDFDLVRLTSLDRTTEKDYSKRRQIEAMVNCPRCYASAGYPCRTNGLIDYPHSERIEKYYVWTLRLLRLNYSTESYAYCILSERIRNMRIEHYCYGLGQDSTFRLYRYYNPNNETVKVDYLKRYNHKTGYPDDTAEKMYQYHMDELYPDMYLAANPFIANLSYDDAIKVNQILCSRKKGTKVSLVFDESQNYKELESGVK